MNPDHDIKPQILRSMAEPFNGYRRTSTVEEFRALNRRRKQDKILDYASKWVLLGVWLALGLTIVAQVVIYMVHHHG